MENSQYKLLIDSLKQYDLIQYIYITHYYEQTSKIINFSVIIDSDSINKDINSLRGIIANLEMKKELLKKSNIIINYTISDIDLFKELVDTPDNEIYADFINSNVIYNRNNKKSNTR